MATRVAMALRAPESISGRSDRCSGGLPCRVPGRRRLVHAPEWSAASARRAGLGRALFCAVATDPDLGARPEPSGHLDIPHLRSRAQRLFPGARGGGECGRDTAPLRGGDAGLLQRPGADPPAGTVPLLRRSERPVRAFAAIQRVVRSGCPLLGASRSRLAATGRLPRSFRVRHILAPGHPDRTGAAEPLRGAARALGSTTAPASGPWRVWGTGS